VVWPRPGLIAKTEVGYGIIVELMNKMVDAGIIDADWVVDLSREPRSLTLAPRSLVVVFGIVARSGINASDYVSRAIVLWSRAADLARFFKPVDQARRLAPTAGRVCATAIGCARAAAP
jgi:hypothetical protein